MSAGSVRVRSADPSSQAPAIRRDADVLAAHLEDAAHSPGGFAAGISAPASEDEVAALVRSTAAILPIGAQSSLTGGATPRGEVLLSTSRLNRIIDIGDDWIRVEAGVPLVALDAALARLGKRYPPVPTFTGAFAGGIVATNAAGAATFKYGATRGWVRALTVALPNGDLLSIDRGAVAAERGAFELQLSDRAVRVPVPSYRMPPVPKTSAGYFAAPNMDLIDLFIGSEGTLGVITDVTLRVLQRRPAECLAFVPLDAAGTALAFATTLRDAARDAWERRDSSGLDVAAIEYMDARCLAILREDGADRACGVRIPTSAAAALLVALELPATTTSAQAFEQIGRTRDSQEPAADGLTRFCRLLDGLGVLERVEIAVPGDRARHQQLMALREAVPAGVNARVGRVKETVDARVAKTAADMIVPFEHLGELLRIYEEGFRRRGLDAAVWGHISDGNLHPNVIPRSLADVESGREAILAFGRDVMRLGGSPLAEHGVGRNPTKQLLLREMYGAGGIDQMRAVKRAIDPAWKMAPGVLFPEAP